MDAIGKMLHKRRVKLVVTQEKRVAEDLDGRTQPGSGNQWNAKGDVSAREILVECKSTVNASISVKVDVLEKIEREAALAVKEPILQIEFQGKRRIQKYAVISWDRLLQLLEAEKGR